MDEMLPMTPALRLSGVELVGFGGTGAFGGRGRVGAAKIGLSITGSLTANVTAGVTIGPNTTAFFLSVNKGNATGPFTFTISDSSGVAQFNVAANAVDATVTGSGTSTLTITSFSVNNITAILQTYFSFVLTAPGTDSSITLTATGATGNTATKANTVIAAAATCYLSGTRILTPTGEVLVEELKTGDLVVTRFGGTQAVKWIGRQSFGSRFVRGNRDITPVRIHAGALADRIPARDLFVSPGHSMLVDGQLVLASSLVNGVTVTQNDSPDEIHYYQIELARHDCLVAEGAWSESFADGPGLRERFHNAGEFAALYPDHAPAEELSLCAPRPLHGPELDAALRGVVARAAASLTPGPLRGRIDRVDAPWGIAGWAQDVDHPELPVLLEVLLGEQVIATVLACDHRQDLMDAGIGQGRNAFFLTSPVRLRPEMVASLRVRRVSDQAAILMTDDCLGSVTAALGLRRVA